MPQSVEPDSGGKGAAEVVFIFHFRSVTPARDVTLPGMITNQQSGTTIDEVAAGIYRISTPVDIPVLPGGFSFNQYLLVDDEPLLFHSGLRRMFPLIREAVSAVIPAEKLRHVGFSHFEADESGALNDFLAIAPQAAPFSSQIGALT